MEKYKPEYPILKKEDMLFPEEIQLIPENEFDSILSAEIKNLRRGIIYKSIYADTPENRQALNERAIYLQMVAHKEGWTFNPEHYQVKFIGPSGSVLMRDGQQTRIFRLKDQHKNIENIGFKLIGDQARRIENDETNSLVDKVQKIF